MSLEQGTPGLIYRDASIGFYGKTLADNLSRILWLKHQLTALLGWRDLESFRSPCFYV